MAERGGFEPPAHTRYALVFETSPFSRSGTSPVAHTPTTANRIKSGSRMGVALALKERTEEVARSFRADPLSDLDPVVRIRVREHLAE